MKVLHIITGLNDGGAEAVLYRLCTRDQAGEHVVVSMMDEGKYGPLLRQAGIPVHVLNMPRGQLRPGALVKLWRIVRAARPDVVQTWMYHADLIGGVVARLAGVRAVVWGIHHTTLEPGKSRRSTIWVARLLARLSRRVPRRIVECAERAAEVHAALGYCREKMVVIPNGYDLTQLRPDAAARARLRAEWGVDAAAPLIGMVARFDPQKDHANLLHALQRPAGEGVSFRCVLVGTGMTPDNQALVEHIAAAGLQDRVMLLGRRDDIPAVMNALDVHVLSSSAEAFPNVLAEAMACGTPCVTTDVGDAAAIVGETGWVVPPCDPAALADALGAALTELQAPDRWPARQQRARSRVADAFSIEAMVGRYHAVWGEAKEADSPAVQRKWL